MELEMHSERVLVKAIEKFGIHAQIIKTIEELAELQVELAKRLNNSDNLNNIVDEIADVKIMLRQLEIMFEVSEGVDNRVNIKVMKLHRLINTRESER